MRITKNLITFLLCIIWTDSQITVDLNSTLVNSWEANLADYDLVYNQILSKTSIDPSKCQLLHTSITGNKINNSRQFFSSKRVSEQDFQQNCRKKYFWELQNGVLSESW